MPAPGVPRLTRDRIVAVARAMVETGGLEALSMRKLAADLGVAPTAIYWHVGARVDLLGAVLDAMIDDLPPIAVRGTTPQARLASVAHAVADQVRDRAVVHQLARQLGRTAEVSMPAQVALAREVGAAGLTGSRAASAVRAVVSLVGGFILLEDVYAQAEGGRSAVDLWAHVDDPAVAPTVRRALSRAVDRDRLFDFAVDRLLAGILADAESSGV